MKIKFLILPKERQGDSVFSENTYLTGIRTSQTYQSPRLNGFVFIVRKSYGGNKNFYLSIIPPTEIL